MPARVDELARSLIEEHGTRAVLVAVERLNQSIDERDIHSRDFWAQVVHAIHERQPFGTGLEAARLWSQPAGYSAAHLIDTTDFPRASHSRQRRRGPKSSTGV